MTLPVGVPAPGLITLTAALNPTDCPKTDGLTEMVSAGVVLAWLTVSSKLPALPPKFVSPV